MASAATLASRVAFSSSASLALCLAERALSSACVCWAYASKSHERTPWFSARTVVTSASQLVASVRILSRSARACRSASSRSMRVVRTRSRVEGCAAACLSLSWS
jgi:hypothetical protein